MIPINLVSGFLGVGKTTALNHLLRSKPADERWAVLVNEFGEIGIDGALLSEASHQDGIEVKELAGGCICCTAGVMFQVSVALLLQNYKPDRLIIEPTGLATLSGIMDTVRDFGDAVDLRSIITLVDPAHWHDPRYREHEVYRDQIDAADILVANRCDLAGEEAFEAFRHEASGWFPPKSLVTRVEHGRIDPQWLDEVRRPAVQNKATQHHPAHEHEHDHGHDHDHQHDHEHDHAHDAHNDRYRGHADKDAVTHGWILPASDLFLHAKLDSWLGELRQHPGLLRCKAVFRTERGWAAHNITSAQHERRRSAYQRDSRIELIFSPATAPDRAPLETALLACRDDVARAG
ncbi:MAG: CobW family GTP-binding protein [Myxococcota bacterium]